jgi:hypothetical protein
MKGNVKRNIFPRGSSATRFWSRHSAPLSRSLRFFVPACCPLFRFAAGAAGRSPSCDFIYGRDGAIRSLKRTSRCKVGNHGPIGDSWPIAFLGSPRGHKVTQRLVHEAHSPNSRLDTLSRNPSVSRTRLAIAENDPRNGTDSLPETLKLLAVSVAQRRNVLLSSTRSK